MLATLRGRNKGRTSRDASCRVSRERQRRRCEVAFALLNGRTFDCTSLGDAALGGFDEPAAPHEVRGQGTARPMFPDLRH